MGTDSFYYISDYSGNYYRINKANQLVAVAGKDEAEVFTFAQANSRICEGKKSSFYCMVPAKEHGELEMPGEMLKEWISEPEPCAVAEQSEGEGYLSPVKELTFGEIQDPVEKNLFSYNLSEMDWAEYLVHFMYIVSEIKDYREELAKKHSDIEQKICDILHYIELCETDDQEAVDLVELLRVCRENRREIKDELKRTEYFQNHLGSSANAAKAKQALKSIKGLETRKYKPRKYDELFENCIMKKGHREKLPWNVTDTTTLRGIRDFTIAGAAAEVETEGMMEEGRIYTIYDGKKNDWLSFARQQAEFYRNVGQYMTNLQITIQEIDQDIEDILLKTESANCNVAQGYKVFKRLKELRLERKEKVQELHCLYALTDYIDCTALADTCERNLSEIEMIMKANGAYAAEVQIVDHGPEQIEEAKQIQDMVG